MTAPDRPPVSRERILEAASRVYAMHGFRGATTRRIAIEAGVNEVTLFRTFGSKGALLEAVLAQHGRSPTLSLPDDPVDPVVELTTFVAGQLEHVREVRPFLLQTMSELDERPTAHEYVCRGRNHVHETIAAYVRTLQLRGLADATVDVQVAAVMLSATVMSDAMARHFVPDIYPPLEEAAERYVRAFLRTIGAPASLTAAAPLTSPVSSHTAPR